MPEYITCYSEKPNPKHLQKTVKILENGGLVIFPTDTVYALCCLSNNSEALEKFSKIKGVKLQQAPLSFLFQDIREISKIVAPMNSQTFKLLKRLLPGPYALILNTQQKLPKPFEKRKTIGVRISSHSFLKNLLPLLKAPLLTSSLHDPDEILDYTTDPEALFEEWGSKIDLMISNGYGSNIPSTVLDLSVNPFKLICEGAGKIQF